MDLQLVSRVLWRFRALLLAGFVLAFTLALLAMVKVSFDRGPSFTYRDEEQWDSVSTLFVTSEDFRPWGEVGPPSPENVIPEGRGAAGVDTGHLTSLAGLYARLAMSDQVLRLTMGKNPLPGSIQAEPLAAGKNNDGDPLPMIGLSAISETPAEAHSLATRHVRAFVRFIEARQAASGIPKDERVVVEIVQNPQRPVLVAPRKKTRSVIVFLAVMVAVVALCFVFENLRPRGPRQLPAQDIPSPLPRSKTA